LVGPDQIMHRGEDEGVVPLDRRTSHTPSVHQQDVGYEWNDAHEQLCQKWKDRSDHYGHLHTLAGKQWAQFNAWLGLPTKVLLSLIASVEFSQLSNASNNASWTFYFNGLAALLTLALEGAQDYLGLGPRATKHFAAATIYEKLAMNIEIELCHPRNQRVNVRAFMRHAKITLQNLKETAPDIPSRILDAYLQAVEAADRGQISQYVRNVPEAGGMLPVPPPPVAVPPPPVPPTNPPAPPPPLSVPSPPTNPSSFRALSLVPPPVESHPEDNINPETDLQDEFAQAMQRKLEDKQARLEAFRLQRFNES